jgi:hypothetical protein
LTFQILYYEHASNKNAKISKQLWSRQTIFTLQKHTPQFFLIYNSTLKSSTFRLWIVGREALVMMLLLSTALSKFTSKCKMGDFPVLEEHLKKQGLCAVFFPPSVL